MDFAWLALTLGSLLNAVAPSHLNPVAHALQRRPAAAEVVKELALVQLVGGGGGARSVQRLCAAACVAGN